MAADLFSDPAMVRDPVALLEATAKQVSSSLRLASTAGTGAMRILANYYTRTTPQVPYKAANGQLSEQPFCVALAQSTLLYHLQMERPNLQDVDLWVELLTEAVTLASENAQQLDRHRRHRGNSHALGDDFDDDEAADDDRALLAHPLVEVVLRRGVLGMRPSPRNDRRFTGLDWPPHMVTLLPPRQFPAFSHLVVGLCRRAAVPSALFDEWARDLSQRYSRVPSPLVAFRAEQLLVRCVDSEEEHRARLGEALTTCPAVVPLEQLRVHFFRLEACVPNVHAATLEDQALIVATSDIFLRFNSPVRRVFVETYLYPTLTQPGLAHLFDDSEARLHLCDLLLRLITPTASTRCPFYMCLCALVQQFLGSPTEAAQLTVTLATRAMPQASYFASTLALDRNMAAEPYANMVLALGRGLALALAQDDGLESDPVGFLIGNQAGVAYRIVATLRAIVRRMATMPAGNPRASTIMVGLRSALTHHSLSALGQFADSAFTLANEADAEPATPSLLIAEMDTVLHGSNLDSAIDSLHEFFADSMERCNFCRRTRASEETCSVNGTVHLPNAQSKLRLARTIAEECGSSETLTRTLADLLHSAPLSPATHRTVFEIVRQSGAHQVRLLQLIDTHLESALDGIAGAISRPNSMCFVDGAAAAQVTSGLVFVTRTLSALSCTYPATSPVAEGVLRKYQMLIRSLLTVFSEENRRRMCELDLNTDLLHHVSLTVWWCCGWLLRKSHARCVQLKPTSHSTNTRGGQDPQLHKQDVIASTNALAILSALNTTHNVSWSMERLVGLAVSRLVTDFNMQLPNIAEHLLAPFGVQRPDKKTLARFALPSASSSIMWKFIKEQLSKSSPFKVAMSAALVQSSALRFRGVGQDLASGLQAHRGEAEPVAPILFTCTVEAIRQDEGLSQRVVEVLVAGMKGQDVGGTVARSKPGRLAASRHHNNAKDQVDRMKATSPSRRLLFAHTLQQVVANLRVKSNGPPTDPLVDGVSEVVSGVKRVAQAAGQALMMEATALQGLAAHFSGGRAGSMAALLTRISDDCAAGMAKAHHLPALPEDFNAFAALPPPAFTDGVAIGPLDAASTAASSVSRAPTVAGLPDRVSMAGSDSRSSGSSVQALQRLALNGGQAIDADAFDRIVALSHSAGVPSVPGSRLPSRSASAFDGGNDFGAWEPLNDDRSDASSMASHLLGLDRPQQGRASYSHHIPHDDNLVQRVQQQQQAAASSTATMTVAGTSTNDSTAAGKTAAASTGTLTMMSSAKGTGLGSATDEQLPTTTGVAQQQQRSVPTTPAPPAAATAPRVVAGVPVRAPSEHKGIQASLPADATCQTSFDDVPQQQQPSVPPLAPPADNNNFASPPLTRGRGARAAATSESVQVNAFLDALRDDAATSDELDSPGAAEHGQTAQESAAAHWWRVLRSQRTDSLWRELKFCRAQEQKAMIQMRDHADASRREADADFFSARPQPRVRSGATSAATSRHVSVAPAHVMVEEHVEEHYDDVAAGDDDAAADWEMDPRSSLPAIPVVEPTRQLSTHRSRSGAAPSVTATAAFMSAMTAAANNARLTEVNPDLQDAYAVADDGTGWPAASPPRAAAHDEEDRSSSYRRAFGQGLHHNTKTPSAVTSSNSRKTTPRGFARGAAVRDVPDDAFINQVAQAGIEIDDLPEEFGDIF